MEVLTLIINKNIQLDGNFRYHLGFKDLKLTHLCFADDLMVFYHGDTNSVRVIKESINEFSKYSGLFQNLKKSTIFFGSIQEPLKRDLLNIVPFSVGKLPMRYLGVPLLAKCLSVSDCRVLIDKVKARTRDWKNRFLSYAGRLQIISSVLTAMQNYRASVYLLPNTVVSEIDKILKGFFWNNSNGRAKIAWKIVCRPKDQGGLGLKPLSEWNEVLLMKHIWKIVEQKQNMWAQWVNKVKLKGRSVWDVTVDDGDSWGWKILMALRNKMRPHVFHIIGNGKMTSVWHDTWHKNGPLSQFISKRDIYDARLSDNDKVADLIENGGWRWPDEWYVKFPELSLFNIPTLTDMHDKVVWKKKKDKITGFKIKDVWEDMKVNYPITQWHKVIWFSQCLPRHTFIMWLALHKRLQTKDRMAKWNAGLNLMCTLCGQCNDSVQHLFFQCPYSKKILTNLKGLFYMDQANEDWDGIIDIMLAMNCKNNIKSIMSKIGTAACVYNVWYERNLRLLQDVKRDENNLTQVVKEEIKWKLISLNVKKIKVVVQTYKKWDIDLQMLQSHN